MRIEKLQFFIAATFSLLLSHVTGQQLSINVTNRVDSLFKEFDNRNTPGCAIGIVRNDTLLYSKGYGMANLEHDIPITPETLFYLASVSKQFTAYSIVLLAKEGKLKLEDDIHNHLSWLPDLKKTITITHLLNHTSGLRDDLEMAFYAGVGAAGIVSQELAINYIKSSRNLNFEPGQKYSYSNSNYVLLAEIVKKVGGKSFKDFAEIELFKPLGMKNSFFLDQPNGLIRNRASSYIRTGNQYSNAFHTVYTLGDGGMFSNINDLAKWTMNFYDSRKGNANDILQLSQRGKLNNGTEISYALGITVNEYKGFKQYAHGGGLAGYRTSIAVYPDIKMGFIILSNLGNINVGGKLNELSDIFLKHYTPGNPSATALVANSDNTSTDTLIAKAISGKYISDDGVQFNFAFREQKLYWESAGGQRLLIQSSKDTFLEPNQSVKFVLNISAKDTTIHQYFTGYDRIMTKYIPDKAFVNKHSELYTGVYYSPELEARYNIILKDGELMLSSIKTGDHRLNVLDRTNMTTIFGSHLKFASNAKQKITGFELNSSRMMHVRFDKVN